jgi:hypothetical protein
MIRRLLPVVLALLVARVAVAVEPDPNCTPPSSTFELIQVGIFDRHDCNMSNCHGIDRQAGLDLRAGNSYGSLLRSAADADVVPNDPSEFKLVEPDQPDQSLLWLTLAVKTLQLRNIDAPPMPKDGLPLSRDEVEAVRLWILAGAPETGVVDGIGDLIDPCPPAPNEDEESIAGLPQCKWNDPMLLLPNLVPDPPADVQVIARNGRRRVEFTTRVGNTGDGPLIIQAATLPAGPGHTVDAMQVILRKDGSKCVHRAGTMRFSDAGNRWQYGNFSDFELRKDDPVTGPVVASSSKPAFCLLDTDPIRSADNRPQQYVSHCTDPVGRMGISAGYKDTYSRVWPGQWIDLDADPSMPIDRGTYYLINIADPNNHLWEKDDKRDDNANYKTMRLGLADPDAGQPPTPAPQVAPTVQPARTRPVVQRTVRPRAVRTVRPRVVRTVRPRPTPRPRPAPKVRTTPESSPQPTPAAAQSRHPVRPAQPSHPASPQHPSSQ